MKVKELTCPKLSTYSGDEHDVASLVVRKHLPLLRIPEGRLFEEVPLLSFQNLLFLRQLALGLIHHILQNAK